jgi:hypothetical protein
MGGRSEEEAVPERIWGVKISHEGVAGVLRSRERVLT